MIFDDPEKISSDLFEFFWRRILMAKSRDTQKTTKKKPTKTAKEKRQEKRN